MYIKRDIEDLVVELSSEYPALLVTGPRQVGKTTMLKRLMEQGMGFPDGADRREIVSLDDLTERGLAKNDPALFLQLHEPPILIDEVQYAPELFLELKKRIDAGVSAGSFWLTGSQPFQLMKLAGESLAGRVALLSMPPLSQHEAWGSGRLSQLRFDLAHLKARQEGFQPANMRAMYERMYRGSMPAVLSGSKKNLRVFYSSYVQTYIERDVRDLAGDVDALSFNAFVTTVAARCSQELNVSALCRDTGHNAATVKAWLGILERSGIIFYLHPYSNNQLTRTVKAPKLYFQDCGLVAYLTRWGAPETMAVGAMSGAFMENYVVSELRKGFLARGEEPLLYYYRDRDAREIDVVLESDGMLHPIEIKRSASPNLGMVGGFSALDRGSVPRGAGAVVCMVDHLGMLDSQTFVVPAWMV